MKKLLSIALIFALLCPVALADGIDLLSMTYDELYNLQQSITLEMMKRPEWKEVTVPPGEYLIGDDIPAGSYEIDLADGSLYTNIVLWGAAPNDFRKGGGLLVNNMLSGTNSVYGRINLRAGNVLVLSGTVIIKPALPLNF